MKAATPRSRTLIDSRFPVFAEAVLEKLDRGAVDYGDASLDLPSGRLLEEIEAELLDVNGWSFLLWNRIQNLKAKLAEIETRATKTG